MAWISLRFPVRLEAWVQTITFVSGRMAASSSVREMRRLAVCRQDRKLHAFFFQTVQRTEHTVVIHLRTDRMDSSLLRMKCSLQGDIERFRVIGCKGHTFRFPDTSNISAIWHLVLKISLEAAIASPLLPLPLFPACCMASTTARGTQSGL